MNTKLKLGESFAQMANIGKRSYALGSHPYASGNISSTLNFQIEPQYESEWKYIGEELENLHGRQILVTQSGSQIHDLDESGKGMGVIEVDENGTKFKSINGFEYGKKSPTSEIATHLRLLNLRKEGGGAVLHAHPVYTNALVQGRVIENALSATSLLWKSAIEASFYVPSGIGWVPFQVPGCVKMGLETLSEFQKNVSAVIWEMHGLIVLQGSLSDAIGVYETIEHAMRSVSIALSVGKNLRYLSVQNHLDLLEQFRKRIPIQPNPLFWDAIVTNSAE